MKALDQERYYTYSELSELLHDWASARPDLARLDSIGKTGEGRDILCLEITARDGVPAEQKSGLLLCGSLHGGEIIPSTAVLSFIYELLESYDSNPALRERLRTGVVYAIPRVNCDGSELCLTTPYWARGSALEYFPAEDGIYPEDINGDGEILQMRIPDPDGPFKPSPLDRRLMVPRGPSDREGEFYQVFTEGLIRGDAHVLKEARPRRALDPNRAFPYNWSMDSVYVMQFGRRASGTYPLYEPEPRALADFLVSHPNIAAINDCHSYGGIHISPIAFCPEREPLMEDAIAFGTLGGKGAALTGYKSDGIFPPGAKDFIKGAFITWAYWMYGVFAWTTEMWSYLRQSNPNRGAERLPHDERPDDQKLMLEWDERENNSRAFAPWAPFEHPQLGRVEIGGWRDKNFKYNPPEGFRAQECKKARDFTWLCLDALPSLKLKVNSVHFDGAACRFSAEVHNTGFLPTSGTVQAEKLGCASGVSLSVSNGDLTLPAVNLGRIPGYGRTAADIYIPGKPGDTITVRAGADRVCPEEISFTLPDM